MTMRTVTTAEGLRRELELEEEKRQRAVRYMQDRRKIRANTKKRLRAIRAAQREEFLDRHGAANQGRRKKQAKANATADFDGSTGRRGWRY